MTRLLPAAIVVVVAAVAIGTGCSRAGDAEGAGATGQTGASIEQSVADSGVVWTCSMHPQVRQNEPGDCPICGMDLIPVQQEIEETSAEGRRISFSDASVALMEIETSPVVRRNVDVDVELVGKVTYDAGRVVAVTAWVPGRIEKLHVDHVGAEVRVGDPVLDLYGPELLAAQRELIEASSAYDRASRTGGEEAGRAEDVLNAVRDRLRLWGISDAQISAVASRGSVEPRITIVSPTTGTVVDERITEGDYVSVGQKLLTIADLSVVWVDLEAHETDLSWLAEGQHADFSVEAVPGRVFHGTVSLVEPVVDPRTRTVTVRIDAANDGGALKPDMFVRAHVAAPSRGPGPESPIVIPATAPLLTGKRAVVYVQVPDAERPTFEGREIVLGPKAGDYYVVDSGLIPGERVVTNGAFKIDSALEIRAMPSMMSPSDIGSK